MGFTSNPSRYTTINASTILSKDDEEEEELDSDVHICNTLIKIIDSPVIIPPKVDEADTPLTVPHLFWWASCSPVNDLLLTFDSLLSVSSHLVIICEDIVNKLKLCHKKLLKPIFTKTAMHDGRKNIIELDKVVKL